MKKHRNRKTKVTPRRAKNRVARSRLRKTDTSLPALVVLSSKTIAIRADVEFAGVRFKNELQLPPPYGDYQPGCDYGVYVSTKGPRVEKLETAPKLSGPLLGGFHFAPGRNASARNGGSSEPAINPCSIWDVNFRPACPDPRGMFFAAVHGIPGWYDIYLLGKDHLRDGTSKFGVTIADGNDPPQNPKGGYFSKLDYDTAVAVYAHHGKTLIGAEEFFAIAKGVTEKSASGTDPVVTGLDAARTSQYGGMQMTGNLWTWCHCGDDDPGRRRASMFGGSWLNGDYAGSRYALVACFWPEDSAGALGARGRGDHLQLD